MFFIDSESIKFRKANFGDEPPQSALIRIEILSFGMMHNNR